MQAEQFFDAEVTCRHISTHTGEILKMPKLMLTRIIVVAYLALTLTFSGAAHADRVKDHERSCQDGDAVSCHMLGMIYEQGEGVARDVEAASQYYEGGCAGGFAFSCYRLGVLKAAEQDPPYGREVLQLFVASCAESIAEGCFVAAESFFLMNEDKKAEKLKVKACELGHPKACLMDFR